MIYVQQLADDLAWMAAWREVLKWKFISSEHHFDLAHLEAELNSFKRVTLTLANSYRSTASHSDRGAA
jgi:hypothetical protein